MSGQQNITSPIIFGGCYVKRFTSQLGFNSSPTSVELELIEGYPGVAEDVTNRATGFMYDALEPGRVSGLTVGAFNFAGIVQSWTRNFSEGGLTFTVKLVDPRIIFDAIPVVMGYDVVSTGNNYPNVLNCFGYYGTPSGAGITNNGVIFKPVRDYLASTGTTINLFNKRFNLVFDSGFADGTGTTNPSGIPPWYSLKSNLMTLSSLLNQVGADMGFDYYAYINPSGNYASTGVVSEIRINTIKRTTASNPTEIDTFLANTLASGTRKSYARGKELRTDATATVIGGAPFTSWTSYNSGGGEVLPYWGRSVDGSAIYSQGSYLSSGMVILDYITGSGVDNSLNHSSYRINFEKITINRTFQDSVYPPPALSLSTTTATTTGCYASENMLRAALFGQESWEAIFYKENSVAAQRIGISNQIFRDSDNLLNTPTEVREAMSLGIINASGRGNRTPYEDALISTVYDAFRTTAEQFYGKQWLLISNNNLTFYTNNSTWQSAGYGTTKEYPDLQYEPVSSAWCESGGYPSGINNHELLLASHSDVFKDEQGRLKAFVSIPTYRLPTVSFPYSIDTSLIPQGEYFIEQGDKLCLPISVEVYERHPSRFIATLNSTVQAATPSGGLQSYANQKAYKDFLYVMGFTEAQIGQYRLDKNIDDEARFGLAPARPMILPSVAQTYGFFIPVQFKNLTFGPWYASGVRPGGITLNTNSDLQPCTYGSHAYLDSVGRQTVAKAISTADVLDSADISIAGLPSYNIGTSIGDNANVTSISLQLGIDGLVTNYSIKTFLLPSVRVSKYLQDKITSVQNQANYNKREIINLNKIVKIEQNQINKASEVRDNVGGNSFGQTGQYSKATYTKRYYNKYLRGLAASGLISLV